MPKKDYQNREVGIWILFRKKDSTVLLYSVFAFSSVKYNPSVSDGKINNFIFNGSIFKVFLYRVMHFFLIFANVIIIVQQINKNTCTVSNLYRNRMLTRQRRLYGKMGRKLADDRRNRIPANKILAYRGYNQVFGRYEQNYN